MPYFGRLLPDRSIDADPAKPLIVQPSPEMLSAFGLPITQEEFPVPNCQLQFAYGIVDRIAVSATTGTGTITYSQGRALLQTGATAFSTARLESKAAARYSPGQGIVWRGTSVFASGGVANTQQEIGIGDDTDGFFFGYSGATFGIFVRRLTVDTFIPQSSWNGTVPTFNPALGNVYQIRFQWLGYGAIRFYVEDPLTGYPILVHTIFYANTSTSMSVRNPTLPCHAKVLLLGATQNIQLFTPSMGIYCEGPFNSFGVPWSTGNRKTAIGAETAVFTIRNNASFLGVVNRSRVHIDSVSSGISNAQDGRVRAVLNATLGGVPVFNNIDASRSLVAVDVAGTTVTGGFEVRRWPQAANTSIVEEISGMELRLAPGDTLTLAATGITGNIDADLGLGWNEEL